MSSVRAVTSVYVTLQIEGSHHWPLCPFDEVAYLRDPHRHIFFIKAYKPVNHDDRDIEFIILKHQMEKYIKDQYWCEEQHLCDFGASSCEQIAHELRIEFKLSAIDVSEDNENGAVVTYEMVD